MAIYHFNLDTVRESLPVLLQGLGVTLELTAISGLIGLVAGFPICLLAMSRWRIVRAIVVLYIEIFRCTPSLVQLIWIFYCVPIFLSVSFDPIPMAILALSLNITAFNAEAYRAALQSIPASHVDAGIALGLSAFKRTLYIMLPQAIVFAIPVLITNTIGLLQQSSLVAIVGIADLMYQGKSLSTSTYRPIEIFTAVAAIYFVISLPVSRLVGALERRISSRFS